MNICQHDEFCGGCIYQGKPYDEQLKIKEKEVLKYLDDNDMYPEIVDAIEGCPSCYQYRNKMEYTFGDMVKGGETTLGMHKKGNFMSIVTVDNCQIVHPDFNAVLSAVLDFVKKSEYPLYNKKTHLGLLRNLIVRRGVRTNEMTINLVTASDEKAGVTFDEEAFVKELLSLGGKDFSHEIVGIMRTIDDEIADAVKCDELKVLYGRDYYNEEIMGLKFKVSAFSFFQTNIEAVERLYTEAINLIDDFEGKTAFDLYCGTGTISQVLALKAKKVVGVELVAEAVEAAKENAKLNGLDNCEFIAGDVFEVLKNVSEKPDVIVVDPPRVGIQPKALDKIISYGVKEIVYVSCNPKTLAQNLKYFEYYGYRCKYLKPFDNFPMTKHIECICLLEK